MAQDLNQLGQTIFVQVTDDIPKSDLARSVESGGYELSQGEYQSFEPWYERRGFSLYIESYTQINEHLGLAWGLSSGEKGEKYEIDPMVKLGLDYQWPITKNAEITLSTFSTWGGAFREKTCLGDYGEIGGLQTVNCRLAATELSPELTLDYLIKDHSISWGVQLQYEYRF